MDKKSDAKKTNYKKKTFDFLLGNGMAKTEKKIERIYCSNLRTQNKLLCNTLSIIIPVKLIKVIIMISN